MLKATDSPTPGAAVATGGENEVITQAVSGPGDWWEWGFWDENSITRRKMETRGVKRREFLITE